MKADFSHKGAGNLRGIRISAKSLVLLQQARTHFWADAPSLLWRGRCCYFFVRVVLVDRLIALLHPQALRRCRARQTPALRLGGAQTQSRGSKQTRARSKGRCSVAHDNQDRSCRDVRVRHHSLTHTHTHTHRERSPRAVLKRSINPLEPFNSNRFVDLI